MATTREGILETLRLHRDTIRAFGVRRLGLFGSCAREEQTTSSDFDFVVELETVSFDAYMGLKLFLEDLLGRPVDLVIEGTIKPRLCPHIMRDLIDVPGL
jgi:predicted nucleotidyltransferase